MNDIELKQLWGGYQATLDKSLTVNQELLIEIKKGKVNSLLKSIRGNRIFAIVVGVLWLFLIDSVILLAFLADGYFLFGSLVMHSVITKIAIGISVYHLILIQQIQDTDSVVAVQQKIAKFRLTTLTSIRLSLLQLPIFTTFYINSQMLENTGIGWWVTQALITILFLFCGIWCFQNIKMKNSYQKWFKVLFNDNHWNSLQKAEGILGQISALKKL